MSRAANSPLRRAKAQALLLVLTEKPPLRLDDFGYASLRAAGFSRSDVDHGLDLLHSAGSVGLVARDGAVFVETKGEGRTKS